MNLKRLLEKTRRKFSALPSDPSDRRRSSRARLDYAVELQDAARKPADGAVHLTDLSGVGVGFASSKDFRVGERLAVMVKTGGREVATRATIRWARPEGVMTSYGVEFEGVGGLDRLLLEFAARPGVPNPGDLAEIVLQFVAVALFVAVGMDWVASDPGRMTALLLSLPWLLSSATGVGLIWWAAKS